jgi:hypothetical protein
MGARVAMVVENFMIVPTKNNTSQQKRKRGNKVGSVTADREREKERERCGK